MRPMTSGEEVGWGNLMKKQSLAAAKELWGAWEIHCLILISLFLQAFLFLTAGIRRRSTSRVLRTVLWLAYLAADSVAIFVLGHLAVHASEPRHSIMAFWAPFLLVHLGGQETITAFSKQDNELWTRHLLHLVFQAGVAGYVVTKVPWPDHHLRAAMALMFVSGCFKYGERTLCLYLASPPMLRSECLNNLSYMLRKLQKLDTIQMDISSTDMDVTFRQMLEGRSCWDKWHIGGMCPCDDCMEETAETASMVTDIMSVDAPLNMLRSILVVNRLPDMLAKFEPSAHCSRVYEFVGARLVDCYQRLYTKKPLRKPICVAIYMGCPQMLLPLYSLFRCVSTPIALGLFRAAEKGGQLHASRADITVSYILLVGAIILDVSSATLSILSDLQRDDPKWSQELAQYSMIKRHAVQRTLWQWVVRRLLGSWGVGLLDLTHISITQDHTPIKEVILDNLLHSGRRKEWNIASSRGQKALQKRMDRHALGLDSALPGKVLDNSIGVDFPTSVLIWHMATEICYHVGDNASTDPDQMKKNKQLSRELSNYIMYLVFKCGVKLTTQSQLVHDRAHDEIREILSDQHVNLGEKDAVRKLFDAKKEDKARVEPDDIDGFVYHNDTEGSLRELTRSTREALYSPVLPRACEVAQVLLSINDESARWGLIAAVWLEMLYYAAPRCGGAFHYEHLSTGGEFITHVLLLMYHLGPFLPTPGT